MLDNITVTPKPVTKEENEFINTAITQPNLSPDIKAYVEERIKETLDRQERKINKTENITYLGFLILIIMLIPLVISYFLEYSIYNEKIYKNDQDFININSDLSRLKNCLMNGGWKICLE